MTDRTLSFQPIGVIRSPHREAKGTPIQPRYAEGIGGHVELLPEFVAALDDLSGFERVWLLYAFDRAGEWTPKVVPFRDTAARGLFATRAPRRPNALGMSCVRLVGVEGNRLLLSEVDILDGTPLLDIKPYVPDYDAYPDAKAGWLDHAAAPQTSKADDRFKV